MRWDLCRANDCSAVPALAALASNKGEKGYSEMEVSGTFMRSTMLDMDSRLRVVRAIEKDETRLPQLGKIATTTWFDRTRVCAYRFGMARHINGYPEHRRWLPS